MGKETDQAGQSDHINDAVTAENGHRSKSNKAAEKRRSNSPTKTSSKRLSRSPKRADRKKRSKSQERHNKRRSRTRSPCRRQSFDEVAECEPRRKTRDRAVHSISRSVSPVLAGDSVLMHDLRQRIEQLEQGHTDPHFTFDERDLAFAENGPLHSSFAENPAENSILNDISSANAHLDNDPFDILDDGGNAGKTGPPLEKQGMKIVARFFDTDPDATLIKTIVEKYPTPEDCPNLNAKSVNAEMYRNLSKTGKYRDFSLRRIQGTLACAATANLRQIDMLAKMYKEGKISREIADSILTATSDSAKLLGKGISDLSIIRKSLMKPHIQPRYQQLCSKRTYGPSLFGDELSKEVKAIDDEAKIMRNFAKTPYQSQGHNSQFRYNPYYGDTRPSKNGFQRGRGMYRPQYSQLRGRRPFRSRGKAPAATSTYTAPQQ